MRFVIVTGVSGAGKTSALKMLEDAKYFCVDNLPIPLLEKFASLMPEIHGECCSGDRCKKRAFSG